MERKEVKIPIEELEAASRLTGKTEPIEIFRELVRRSQGNGSEKGYWETRLAKDKVIEKELHLAREVAAMQKDELEKIARAAPPQLPEILYCYKCHKTDHWPSQCTTHS